MVRTGAAVEFVWHAGFNLFSNYMRAKAARTHTRSMTLSPFIVFSSLHCVPAGHTL